jgi:hypothetical protein
MFHRAYNSRPGIKSQRDIISEGRLHQIANVFRKPACLPLLTDAGILQASSPYLPSAIFETGKIDQSKTDVSP